jgi:hypothetical protein
VRHEATNETSGAMVPLVLQCRGRCGAAVSCVHFVGFWFSSEEVCSVDRLHVLFPCAYSVQQPLDSGQEKDGLLQVVK